MDRPTTPQVPAEHDGSSWDPLAIWRQRVKALREMNAHHEPDGNMLNTSKGWDPTETWRLRIHAPRVRR
jgi:hypothetical protein